MQGLYGLLSKLLLRGDIQFKDGKLIAFKRPHFIMSMHSLKSMTDQAMNEGIKAITDLYFHGWVYGIYTTQEIIEIYKLKKFQERYKTSMDIIGILGFGDYKTLKFTQAIEAKFRVLGDPFPELYYKFDKPVCHFMRGVEAGGGTLVHETLMDNIEFECAAINGTHCIHANLNQEKIAELDKELVKSQLDLNYLKKRQKKCLEEAGYDPSNFGM